MASPPAAQVQPGPSLKLVPSLPKSPRLYSLLELSELVDPGDRWILPGVLPTRSKALVYGQSSVGKTWLVLDLALSVASGAPFLDEMHPAKTGPVVVFSTEGDLYTNKDRYLWTAHGRGVDFTAPLYHVQDGLLLDDAEDRAKMLQIVRAVRPVLVVLDPLDSFFWGEENSATATKPIRHFLNYLVADASDRGAPLTILAVHHEGVVPPDAASNPKKPRGSSAWYGWADTVIHVGRDRKSHAGAKLALTAQKQRNGKTATFAQVAISIDEANGLVTFDLGEPEPYGYLTAHIQAYLKDHVAATISTLRTEFGGRATTIRAAICWLLRHGRIERTKLLVSAGAGRFRAALAYQLPTPDDAVVPSPKPAGPKNGSNGPKNGSTGSNGHSH